MRTIIFGLVLLIMSSFAYADTVTITGSPATSVNMGATYTFKPIVTSSVRTAKFTFIIVNKPSWATFNRNNGTLSGIATPAGVYSNIVITVTSSKGGRASLPAFSIVVIAPNSAPMITSIPSKSNVVGDLVSFQVLATDPNGDAITFAASGLPNGVTINSAGYITGTVSAAGTFNPVVVVTDSKGATDSTSFAWTVIEANVAPVVTPIAAQNNTVGDIVGLQVIASDPNGDAITFAVSGLPAGVTIGTSGYISGTVTTAGAFNPTVTVTDSKGAASSIVFAWDVQNPVPVRTALVTWVAPTQNTDGSLLTDLAGFKIYYSQDQANIKANTVDIPIASITSAEITELAVGTWYFAMTAINSTGVESNLTEIVYKTFP